MYRKLTFLISLVALLALANGALAAVYTGAVDDQFCDPGNWDTLAVPGPGEEAEIAGFDVVVDCDVTAGQLRGPGWDTGDAASLTINAGKTVYFDTAARHESDSPWILNLAGSLTIDHDQYRFADEGQVTWNISGAGASLLIGGNVRAGDNGGTAWNLNMDSGVAVFSDNTEIGDDGSGIWNISGTASLNFLEDFLLHGRDGGAVLELNVSGSAEVLVAGRLETNDKGGSGSVTINMDGGTLNIQQDLRLGTDAPGTLNVTGGLVIVGDTLRISNGAADITGGEVQAGDLDISNGTMSLTEGGGALILDGNKLATVGALASAGKLIALPCGSERGIVADYDVTNPGKTTVIACCSCIDVCQAWRPVPASGATEIQSVITEVVLSWTAGDCVGTRGRHFIYFGTDPVAVENAVVGDPENIAVNRATELSINVGNLPLWTTHYWRIDEFNEDTSTTKGELWNFTTGCEAIVGDINMDCLVNFDDYAALAATFGQEEFWPE